MLSAKAGREPLNVLIYDTLDSTNLEARRYVLEGGKTPTLIIAEEQSAGRGRMGRAFYSPPKTGLYASLLIETGKEDTGFTRLTSIAAVAVARAIEEMGGGSTRIKWVNDLLIDEKKVCGILAESFFFEGKKYAVIGFGVNMCTDKFPETLEKIAASVGLSGSLRTSLAKRAAENILDIYDEVINGEISYMREYRERSAVIGRDVRYILNGEEKKGVAIGIDERGGLCVRNETGEVSTLNSGEISLRINEGE